MYSSFFIYLRKVKVELGYKFAIGLLLQWKPSHSEAQDLHPSVVARRTWGPDKRRE